MKPQIKKFPLTATEEQDGSNRSEKLRRELTEMLEWEQFRKYERMAVSPGGYRYIKLPPSD